MINEQKEDTALERTINKKNIFSLIGDLNRMRTSSKTTIEKINIKK
jgi:hypothetical protein